MPSNSKPATVFVVDDDADVRGSLRFLFDSAGHRVEVFASANEFLAAFDPSRPGCLVADVRMPGMSGVDLQTELIARGCTIPIIFISGHADVPIAVRAMKAGASDFIEKPYSDQLLLDRVQRAIEDDAERRREAARRAEARALYETLSPREREVMALVVRGKANKQIAAKLDLSQKTIEVHRSAVMRKLRVQNVPDLVRVATLVGLAGGEDEDED